MAHVSQQWDRLIGPHHDRIAYAGFDEIFQIGNLDLPRERRDVHYAHFVASEPAFMIMAPANRQRMAGAQDYSSSDRLQLPPFSALLGTVDYAGVSPRFAKHGESSRQMGRKSSSTSASRVIRENNQHPSADSSDLRADRQQNPRKVTRNGLEVVDDFPEIVSVTQRELDVIETYLGSLLDELLRNNS